MTALLRNIRNWLHHPKHLDIIGDVHGYADELGLLLQKMGYKLNSGVWSHSFSKAVFVGDFINRGPKNKKTLDIIKNMVDNNKAYAILGNHEINAISYFTKRSNGHPIRMPGSTNRRFFDKMKNELSDGELLEYIKWLKRLPLFLDFGQVRIVHAYWNDDHIELIKGAIHKGKLTKDLLKEISKGTTEVSKAFLQTTRGVEYCFPTDMIVKDSFKRRKITFRVKWWLDPYDKTYEELKFESKSHLPDIPIAHHLIEPYAQYPDNAPPVFIGHYCMGNKKLIQRHNICCVDSCIANGKKLTAYRWRGEQHLKKDHVVSVNKIKTEYPISEIIKN